MMSVISLVQSHYHEGSPVGKRSLRWEEFVEKVRFEPGVKTVSGDDEKDGLTRECRGESRQN